MKTHLPMQAAWIPPLVRDPTCLVAKKNFVTNSILYCIQYCIQYYNKFNKYLKKKGPHQKKKILNEMPAMEAFSEGSEGTPKETSKQ